MWLYAVCVGAEQEAQFKCVITAEYETLVQLNACWMENPGKQNIILPCLFGEK